MVLSTARQKGTRVHASVLPIGNSFIYFIIHVFYVIKCIGLLGLATAMSNCNIIFHGNLLILHSESKALMVIKVILCKTYLITPHKEKRTVLIRIFLRV